MAYVWRCLQLSSCDPERDEAVKNNNKNNNYCGQPALFKQIYSKYGVIGWFEFRFKVPLICRTLLE